MNFKSLGGAFLGMALILQSGIVAAHACDSPLIVSHPPTDPPTYIDNGAPGSSPGDVRIFHFPGVTQLGQPVITDWIMTTTGVDTAAYGVESRVATAVFSFDGFDNDQVVIEGVGLYPDEESVFTANSTLFRSIIGGTGRYKGVSGEVESVHFADGSWQHIFHFDDGANAKPRKSKRCDD